MSHGAQLSSTTIYKIAGIEKNPSSLAAKQGLKPSSQMS